MRILPQAGAEELHALGIDAACDQGLHDRGHGVGAVGNENGIGQLRRLRDVAHRSLHLRPVGRIALERDDPAAPPRHDLLERRLHHAAIGIVGNERGDRPFVLRDGIADDAVDVGLGKKAQQIDPARGDVAVGRERDHRHVARPRGPADRTDREREQRAQDDLGAFVERLLRRLLRTRRAAAVVLHQQLEIRVVEFRERHLGGVAHGLRRHRRVAACGQRQDETDLDLAFADIGRGLGRPAGRGAGPKVTQGKVPGTAGQHGDGCQGGEPRGRRARRPRTEGLQCSEHGAGLLDDDRSCRRSPAPATGRLVGKCLTERSKWLSE